MNKKLLTITPIIIIIALLGIIAFQFAKSQFSPSNANSSSSAPSGPKAGQQEAAEPAPDPETKKSQPPQSTVRKD
jgi:hypothetical protein